MVKSGWMLGLIFAFVFAIVASLELGLAGESENSSKISAGNTEKVDLFSSASGYRFQQGLPSHWKRMVMNP